MARRLRSYDWAMFSLLIFGGLNWLLVGALHYDLIAAIFGIMTPMARIFYISVGLTAVYMALLAGNLARK